MIDYGTVHSYPQGWGETADPVTWGEQWIGAHAAAARPSASRRWLEEFGLRENAAQGVASTDARHAAYDRWLRAAHSSGLSGFQF